MGVAHAQALSGECEVAGSIQGQWNQQHACRYRNLCEVSRWIKLIDKFRTRQYIKQRGRLNVTLHQSVLTALEQLAQRYQEDWSRKIEWMGNEGGELAANNIGIRQKADKPAGQRVWNNIEIELTQKDFFQHGLSGWVFCSRKNTRYDVLVFDQSYLYPFERKPPKAQEPLSFWRETSQSPGTLTVDQPTNDQQPMTNDQWPTTNYQPQRN